MSATPLPVPGAHPRPVDEVPAALRTAALYLHGLAAADRDWLLARLEPVERAPLAPLLVELEQLGVPGDRTLLDEAMEPPRLHPDEERLRQASPGALAAALEGEPAGLVRRLLELEAWPWREGLLRRLDPAVRRAVADPSRAARSAGPALRASIVGVVAERLEASLTGAPRRPLALLRVWMGRR